MESLQRSVSIKIFHLGCGLLDLASFIGQSVTPCHMPGCGFGWWFRYLTIWGLVTQSLFFFASFFCDFLGRTHWLQKHRDRFFAMCFPLGTAIGIIFWTAIFPIVSSLRHGMTLFQSILQHGATTLFIWIELFIVCHHYGKWWIELLIFVIYGLVYLGWNIICHSKDGVWAYPFQKFPLGISIGIYLGMFLFFIGLYFSGKWLTRIIHKKKPTTAAGVSESWPETDKEQLLS